MRSSQEWAEIGKWSETKSHGTPKYRGQEEEEEDPAGEIKEKQESCKQNQDGVASQMPSEKRISGRRELLR